MAATVIERAIGNLAETLAPDRRGKEPPLVVALFARAEFAAIVTSNRHSITRADVEWAFRWLRGRRVHDPKSFLVLLEAWVSVAPPWEVRDVTAAMLALPTAHDAPLAEWIRRNGCRYCCAVTNEFKVGAGPAPNSQGDLLVGDGAGSLAVAPLPPATPAHAVLLAGPPVPSPSTRLQWTPLTVASAGTGAGTVSLVAGSGTAPSFSVKGLVAGTGVLLTHDVLTNNVVIDAAPGAADVTLDTVAGATGVSLVAPPTGGVGPDLKIRGILAGAGITTAVSGDTKDIIISAAAAGPTPVTELTYGVPPSLPGGASSYKVVVPATPASGSVELRYFTDDTSADGGIAWTQAGNYLTGKATLTGVTLDHVGVAPSTVSLVNDGVGPSLAVKGVTAGTGITLAGSTATDVSVAANFTVESAGGGPISLVATTSAPGAPVLKTLVAGPNITITDSGSNLITIGGSVGTGSFTSPRHAVLWYDPPSTASGALSGGGVGSINFVAAATWYDMTLYSTLGFNLASYTRTGASNQTVVLNTGLASGCSILVSYHLTCKITGLTGGIAAGVFSSAAAAVVPQTVRQALGAGTSTIATLECSVYLTGITDGTALTLQVRSLGGTDSAVEFYSTLFCVMQVFPNI